MNPEHTRLGIPDKIKVITLFGGKNYFFKIPKYQRSYVWSDKGRSEQLIQFWDDFLDTEKSRGNLPFLGNLILSMTGESSVYEVVDGQQRLVTLQIFLRVLRSKLTEIAGSDTMRYKQTIDSLQQTLVSYDEYGEQEMLKVTTGKDIDVFFRELMLTGRLAAEPAKRDRQWYLWNAHEFFLGKVEEYIRTAKTAEEKAGLLIRLFKRIGEVEFIIILLRDQSDAYEVFESFNAKGERLNTADLFKNLLLSKLEDKDDKAYEKWDETVVNVEKISRLLPLFSVDAYLRYYWSSTYGYVNPRSLYREIKDNTSNYKALLDGLLATSRKLSVLLDVDNLTPRMVSDAFPSDKDPAGKESAKVVASLQGLTALRTQQYIVWLICLLNNWKHIGNRRHLANSLRSIERFSVLYFLGGGGSSNRTEKIFSALSKELSACFGKVELSGKDKPRSKDTLILDAFNQYIEQQELLPAREEFVSANGKLELKAGNKRLIRFLLERLEHGRRKSSELTLNRQVITVEHLLPQKPDADWHLTKDQIKGYVNLLGNLTLLDFEINGSVKSAVPSGKVRQDPGDTRKFLDDSELKLTEEVVAQWRGNGFVWSGDLIRQRHRQLTEQLYELFGN